MEFIGYGIFDSKNKIIENSIKVGKSGCIANFLRYAPFGDWDVAKNMGHKCKKILINIQMLQPF